jgi:hypothetical protein
LSDIDWNVRMRVEGIGTNGRWDRFLLARSCVKCDTLDRSAGLPPTSCD